MRSRRDWRQASRPISAKVPRRGLSDDSARPKRAMVPFVLEGRLERSSQPRKCSAILGPAKELPKLWRFRVGETPRVSNRIPSLKIATPPDPPHPFSGAKTGFADQKPNRTAAPSPTSAQSQHSHAHFCWHVPISEACLSGRCVFSAAGLVFRGRTHGHQGSKRAESQTDKSYRQYRLLPRGVRRSDFAFGGRSGGELSGSPW